MSWLWSHGFVHRKSCDLDGPIRACPGTLARHIMKRHFPAFLQVDGCQGTYKHWALVATWWESISWEWGPTRGNRRKRRKVKERTLVIMNFWVRSYLHISSCINNNNKNSPSLLVLAWASLNMFSHLQEKFVLHIVGILKWPVFFFFNWSIADLQYCISLRCIP